MCHCAFHTWSCSEFNNLVEIKGNNEARVESQQANALHARHVGLPKIKSQIVADAFLL